MTDLAHSPIAVDDHAAHPTSTGISNEKLAMWAFLGSECLLFGGLINGTSGRHLSAEVFPPQLAGNLTLIIQGLVVLFIGADVLVLYVWQRLRKARADIAQVGT